MFNLISTDPELSDPDPLLDNEALLQAPIASYNLVFFVIRQYVYTRSHIHNICKWILP
jgi:hypothetical protein